MNVQIIKGVCPNPGIKSVPLLVNMTSLYRREFLIKTLVHRALMICSKTKLGSELNKIKQLLSENGYPTDVLLSCSNQKLASFAAEKTFDPEKCPIYLKFPWIGTVLPKYENQSSKAIASCFYAVSPMWFTTQELCYNLLKEIAFLPPKKVV